jgi:DNA polymerase III subunit alpha
MPLHHCYTTNTMAKFVHLHTHSHYSLLNALPTPKELVASAVKDNMSALALTDSGTLYGAIDFYKECKKAKIKPIIGVDSYLATRTRFDKEAGIDNQCSRLVLLAKNSAGYSNLIKIVTASFLEGFYYKPRIDRELLEKHKDGLIAIIPSFSGEIAQTLRGNDQVKAREILKWYTDTFTKNSVFIEVTRHSEIPGHNEQMDSLIAFGKANAVPLVAAHDTYYINPEDRRAREALVKIQSGTTFAEDSGFDDNPEDFSFISQDTAIEYFRDLPEALENTIKIAEMCDLTLELGRWIFPNLELSSGENYDDELKIIAYKGFQERGLEQTKELTDRLEYELSVIKTKKYASYFLVVADLMRFSRKHNIYTNIRGSVAGSLATYLTGITKINPLDYNIPFERFLNPERPSAPDIDMDFADNRRDEVIKYAKEKFGDDKVAQIGTFGTMMARASVRDIARALGHSYNTGDKIAKLIPIGAQGFPMSIKHALEITPELEEMYKKEHVVKEILDLAKKIEGKARHISVHAAGVVIAPTPLTDYVPLQFDPKGESIITQYDMYSVSEEYGGVGLVKFDFLGIKNLSILADSVERVKKERGINIDIENIPLDDNKTYEMLARGETMGLFQLGGSGMTRFLKELKPTRIHDINAMVALYRPGPLESIPEYIERKHNPHLISYLDPRMKDILDQSYGVITYQDDVLLIAVQIAGYSWLEADKLRKAMGKKIPAEMEAQKEKFIQGAITNGLSNTQSGKLWKLIEPFAAYGFNKAHAASYGRVAYQTAYMKANYPLEYMASLLSADAGNVDKVAEAITECVRIEVPVLPPDINESFGDFTVLKEQSAIRFGLYSIKNFGTGIADTIIEERVKNGRYTSLANFLSRIQDRNLNKKSLESLIKCGALDAFGERGTMFHNIEHLLSYNKECATQKGQDSLFESLPQTEELTLEPCADVSQAEKLSWEKELLGLYISGHPLDPYKEKLKRRGKTIAELKAETHDGVSTVLGGIVEDMRMVITKGGERMAFGKISDYGDSIEVVFFPRIFTEFKELLEPEKCIALKGRLSTRNGEKSIVAEAVKAL